MKKKISEIFNKQFDKYCDKLEKLGVNDITEKESNLGICILIFLHILIYGILILFIPKLFISIPLVVFLILLACVYFYLSEKDDYGNDDKVLYTGIYSIPLSVIVLTIILKLSPYRGNDPMMIRKYKLRTLKRKMIRNKLKFWK